MANRPVIPNESPNDVRSSPDTLSSNLGSIGRDLDKGPVVRELCHEDKVASLVDYIDVKNLLLKDVRDADLTGILDLQKTSISVQNLKPSALKDTPSSGENFFHGSHRLLIRPVLVGIKAYSGYTVGPGGTSDPLSRLANC